MQAMVDRVNQLKQMHEADPRDTFCTYALAMEYAKTNALAEALAWLDRTLEIDPEYAYCYYQKARLLAGAGRQDEARQAIARGIEAAKQQQDDKALSELHQLLATLGQG
jgi:tetratricopeptide (TPR) repeat protein